MDFINDITSIFGVGIYDYEFLVYFIATVLFCYCFIVMFMILSSIFKKLGGWK